MQDRFVGIGPSSGNSSFRTNTLQQPEASANAAAQAFFQQQAHHRSQAGSPYNFEAVHGALPRIASPAPGWAKSSKDFAATLQHREGSQRTWEKSRLRDTPGHAAIDQDIPSWAAEFQRDNHAFTSGPMASTSLPVATMDSHRPHFIPSLGTANGLPYTGMQNQLPLMQPGYSESQQQYSYPPPHMHATAETRASEMIRNIDEVSWETAFAKHLEKTGTQLDKAMQTDSVQSHESLTARPTSPSQLQHGHDADLLSKTARELLQSVSHDLTTNTKMRESGFMSLMQKLRDKDVVVEGNQMVAQSGNNQTRPSVSGLMNQALANAAPLAARTPVQSTCLTPLSLHEGTLDAAMRSNQQSSFVESAEDLQAAYDEMNATLDRDVMERQVKAERAFVGDAAMLQEDDANDFALDDALLRNGPAPPTMSQMLEVNPQQQEWATFQDQWERHDAEPATMARPTSTTEKYAFHTRNPYLLDPASTRSFTPDSLLAREADVQRDPLNSRAWLSLGLKQQENEREALAIQALKQAIELEPSMKEAWLALAVSYTNDNLRSKAHDAIDRWVACKPEYSEVLQKYRLHHGSVEEQSTSTSRKHDYLTGLLVDMARAGTGDDHHIDAEVQIALGILFNASEEYEKAADCFSAALSVRPDVRRVLHFPRISAEVESSCRILIYTTGWVPLTPILVKRPTL